MSDHQSPNHPQNPNSDATFSLKIYQIPLSQSAPLLHRIATFVSGSRRTSGLCNVCLTELHSATESKEWQPMTAGEILACLIPERLPRPRELPRPRWPSSLPLMPAPRTQSPSPSVRNFLTFMIACKDSSLKLGYAGEISLSNSSLLAAHEGRHISPFPFKVVFFF